MNEWISVENLEERPIVGERYIVHGFMKNDWGSTEDIAVSSPVEFMDMAIYIGDEEEQWEYFGDDVDYWMHKPNPPEVE